jgi:hypothetical protein
MNKRLSYALAACGLAAGLIGTGLAASPARDNVLDRYPGSVQIANDTLDLRTLTQGALRWQGTYQTPDALSRVRGWYAARLQISPASDQYLTGGDGCAWLSQSALVARFQRTVSVLLCPVPAGTRVVVNESVAIEQ